MKKKNIKEKNKNSKISYTFPPKKVNFLSKFEYDNDKYNMTKINTVINNNPFNIILLDKKNKRNYRKKNSFSNISVTNSFTKERNYSHKDIKSEVNFDESREKLQQKINGLLTDKSKFRKISPDVINLEIHSENINNNNNKKYNLEYINKNDNINNQIELNNKSINNIANNIITNEDNKEEDISQSIINENVKVNDLMKQHHSIYDKKNQKEKNKKSIKSKMNHSFTSLQCNLTKENEPIDNNENKLIKKKSIISEDYKNNNKETLFSSINDLLTNDDNNDNNREYNININKEKKRYKNIKEIKDDKNYFRILYLSSNLLEIIKNKSKYQLSKNQNNELNLKEEKDKNNKNLLLDLNNQNYYIYTNDRNVLKLTALFFQKVQKAIYLFNTGKFENAYKSLLEDKIIENKKMFALFLLIIQGIDKEKLYNFMSKNSGVNKNFSILKYYLSYFNFSHQTIIISFNFLLETISIPSKNNNDFISLFTEAYIRDNKEILAKNKEMGKTEIKKICGLVLKLNNIMFDPDEEKHKNKEDFINSNINDTSNWNPDLNYLISNDPSSTIGLMNYSHVCGYVYDEYIKNENSISQQKNNQLGYNELLYKKILVNKSFSFQNSLIKSELKNIPSESKFIEKPENRKKKISIISNNKILFKPSRIRKNIKNKDNQIKISNEGKEENDILEEDIINGIIKLMKKGEKFSKIINTNGRTVKINFILTQDENNIFLIKDLCCERKEIISIDDISDCTIGYSQNLKTNKKFENYMTILLNTEQCYEFYHSDKEIIQNWVKSLQYLVQKRNKVSTMLSQKEKLNENKISEIWQTDFLPNWSYYRKYIIKKKNKKIENNLHIETSNNNRKEKILKIWSFGLPFWLRPNIWKLVVVNELNITEVLFQGYSQLVAKEQEKYNIINKQKQNISINCSIDILDENYNTYETISKDCKKIIKRIKNILNDIPNKFQFKNEVFKIIRSFCLYRPDLIYNKNISEFAIFFYINCDNNEYDAFVILCNFIINNYLFKYIQNDTLFIENQLKFFEKLIEKYLPTIHLHFKELQFNINIFFYKWVEFLFLKTINYKICQRIFDNFILKGEIFVFELSIAILYILRKEILNSDESGLVYLLKKNIITINEEALFDYINSIDIKKEYNDYFNLYIIGKEKIELFHDL